MSPKIQQNQQVKKQNKQSAMQILNLSKMEQEELLKENKFAKTMKNLQTMYYKELQLSPSGIELESNQSQNEEKIYFEDTLEYDIEDDEEEKQLQEYPSNLPSSDRHLRYDQVYGESEDLHIHLQEVDLKQCLKNHKIPCLLRAKMIDWMIEVFANYKQSTSDKTYFRAVFFLDLFFKKCQTVLKESDVHLFGIASIFLATKQEDISHISLDDIVEKVAHRKFDEKKIREAEYDILKVSGMQSDLPTPYTYLCRYIFKIFQSNQNSTIVDITQTSIYILKMCLHDYSFLEYKLHILSFSVLFISLKFYFNSLRSDNISEQQESQLKKQEIAVIDKMFKLIPQEEHNIAGSCSNSIKELFLNFQQKYPELKNLDKFCT